MLRIAIALITLTGCTQVTNAPVRPNFGSGTTLITAGGSSSVAATGAITITRQTASSTFFGLTVLNYQQVTPQLTFGTARTWDAWPALDWTEANPAAGQYNFAPLNTYISTNLSRGMQILYTFGRTPQWASTSSDATGPTDPVNVPRHLSSHWINTLLPSSQMLQGA